MMKKNLTKVVKIFTTGSMNMTEDVTLTF